MRIHKDEMVSVLSGRDRGKQGKVQRVFLKEGLVLVEGLNMVKRHKRPTGTVRQAGIVEQEAPIPMSRVMLVCPKCTKPTTIGYKFLEDNTKVRVCKSCKEVLD